MKNNKIRNKAIQTVKELYPPNSLQKDTAKIGKEIMVKSLAECWESLPTDVLQKMSELCSAEER